MSRSTFARVAVVAGLALFPAWSHAAPITYVNETNLPSEADYAALQFPTSMALQANQISPIVYGQIYEAGLTDPNGPAAGVLADVGYGPLNSDPRTAGGWSWLPAVYNVQVGNNDEYQMNFPTPGINGQYSYTYRFSIDSGATYTLADVGGAGSNVGLTYDPTSQGVMTITGGIDLPEPASAAIIGLLTGTLALRRKR